VTTNETPLIGTLFVCFAHRVHERSEWSNRTKRRQGRQPCRQLSEFPIGI